MPSEKRDPKDLQPESKTAPDIVFLNNLWLLAYREQDFKSELLGQVHLDLE